MRFGVRLPPDVEEAFDYFTARLEDLGIMLTSKGVFAYFVGHELIKSVGDNFIQSLLRRDYLSWSKGSLRGAQLSRVVTLYMNIVRDAAKEKILREPDCPSVQKAAFSPEP